MKKSLIVHIVVIIAATVIGSYLAGKLIGEQGKISKSSEFRSNKPLGGCHKLAADIQWMLFVNYCGSLDSITDENSPIVYQKLDQILRNDPDFVKAYEIGSMMLSVRAPEKALEILDRGCRNENLNSNWKLPFLAGYVMTHNIKGKARDMKKAEDYFRLAVQRSSPSESHVVSSFLRAKAANIEKRKQFQGIKLVHPKQAMLFVLLQEWKNAQKGHSEMSSGSITTISDIDGKVLKLVQEIKAESPEDPDIIKTIEQVRNTMLKGKCLCDNCLATYSAGDKFCSDCGSKVEIYGTCTKCGEILKGNYCSACGTKKAE